MAKTTSGGQGVVDFFRLNVAEDGTITINDGLTILATPVAATANSDRAFRAEEIVGTSPEYQEDGTVQVTWDQQEDSPELDAFLDAVAVPPSSNAGALPSYTKENGIVRSQASVNNNLVLMVYYGANNGTDIKTHISAGTISPTSGSFSAKSGDWNKPTLKFIGTKLSKDLTIGTALFDSTIITPAAAVVLAKNTGFVRPWIPAA